MGFIKVLKNKAWSSRYNTKNRRRREHKTDYAARIALLYVPKNLYAVKKHRLVVRFSTRAVTAQIFAADLDHDVCLCSAHSSELKRYGIPVGFSNWAAGYATGLLLARRVMTKYKLDKAYAGNEEVDGEYYVVRAKDKGAKPFKAVLDVGLARTSTGAKVFSVLKGAADGGLDIPHSTRRFPGCGMGEDGELEFEPEVCRKYIFGGHVAEYMKHLQEEDAEAYKRQFSRYIENGIGPDDIEDMYTKAHAAIRANPNKLRDPLELGHFKKRAKPVPAGVKYENKRYNRTKTSLAQKKGRIKQKLLAAGKVSIPDMIAAAEAESVALDADL